MDKNSDEIWPEAVEILSLCSHRYCVPSPVVCFAHLLCVNTVCIILLRVERSTDAPDSIRILPRQVRNIEKYSCNSRLDFTVIETVSTITSWCPQRRIKLDTEERSQMKEEDSPTARLPEPATTTAATRPTKTSRPAWSAVA